MVGEELGNYRVVAPLGKGGMASVYVGEHKVLGHKVAIKILHPKHLANESIERRFFNEARAIASIKHPSVVELVDFGRAPDGRAYIVMELLDGESLRARIRAGIMDERIASAFARQVASGLYIAHERGIVHRDLKPDNIFLVRDPEVEFGERAKVLDFGIAKQSDLAGVPSEHTATGILVGTPAYMSPEQCRGSGVVDARSDIYSLGVVLYRMVTNQLPFEAAGTGELIGKHLYVEPRSPNELNPDISDQLNEVVMRCLRKEAGARYASMREVADALQRLASAQRASIATPDEVLTLPVAKRPQLARSVPNTPKPGMVSLSAESGSERVTVPIPRPDRQRQLPPEELPTEIQGTPSPYSSAGFDTLPPDEETHPTTLRTATGERASVAWTEPRRRTIAIALSAVVVTVVVAMIATAGSDDSAPDPVESAAPASEPASKPATEPVSKSATGSATEPERKPAPTPEPIVGPRPPVDAAPVAPEPAAVAEIAPVASESPGEPEPASPAATDAETSRARRAAERKRQRASRDAGKRAPNDRAVEQAVRDDRERKRDKRKPESPSNKSKRDPESDPFHTKPVF